MANYAEGIRDVLVIAGIGIFGTDLFIGKMPERDGLTTSIMHTGGKTANPKWLLDEPSMQVMIRGAKNDYVAAHTQAVAVKDVLLGLPSQDISGDRWVQINAIGDIVNLGFDEENRVMFSTNWALIIQPAASVLTNRQPLS